MLSCEKRQTVVKRGQEGSLTLFRCLNKQCGVHGQMVDEGTCGRCPARVIKHERPCPKAVPINRSVDTHPVTAQEMLDVSDEEVMQMIKDAGLDAKDFDKAQWIGDSELPPDYPPMSMQLWTYKEALIRWAKAGRPTRTQEEVEHIHKTCCEPCEWYDKEQQRCKGCGCKVTVGAIAVFNKLKMATEKCPRGRF